MNRESAHLRAIGWALSGACLYTLVFASARFIGPQSSPIQIVFMSYLISAVMVAAVAVFRLRGTGPLRTQVPGVHLARAVASVLAQLCLISAPLFIAYEDATAIGLTDSVVTMLLAVVLLKERAGLLQWVAAATCLLGAVVVARADAAASGFGAPEIGLALAAGGAVFAGVELFFIKILSERDDPITIILIVNLLGALLMLGPAMWVWEPITGRDFLWLMLIGPLLLAEEYCWIKALRGARAMVVVPFGYASIPFAAAVGAVVFHEHLGGQEIAGAALVVIVGIALARLSTQKAA